ncbi:hypothetical protein ACFZAV_40660 [Streptomyces sp. NPDC008343]|uniref:hypothetical protein n=1 Tax=Streptomyces sp. NPDC008343 TaxID=3364828 RepID=UPI0036E79226
MLRHDQRLADMVGDNSGSESAVRRWRDEVIALLAAQTPRLDLGLKKVAKWGRGDGPDRRNPHPTHRRAGRPTGGTTPANTTITACTSSP